MAESSNFESRTGRLAFSSEVVYTFVSDIRNFERFIPDGTVNYWVAEKEYCSFEVSVPGVVRVRLVEKDLNNKVVFEGDVFKKNDFSLVLNINETGSDSCEVKVSLKAVINPILKMMAAKPIAQFIDKLLDEMEKFKDWRSVRE